MIELLVFPSVPWSWKYSFWGNLQVICFSPSVSCQCGWTATERAGPPSQTPLSQQGSSPAPVGTAAGCQLLGSQALPGHTCQGTGTASGSDICWLTAFLLCVWSHAASWKFRGDFSMGWWHGNSLCASVHWPDEPGQTQWQTWWTLQKLPKRELVADLELLTWSKPWATQWLLLFSWLPQIAAWRQKCSISGVCFLIFY